MAKVLYTCHELSKNTSLSTLDKIDKINSMPETSLTFNRLEGLVFQLFGINNSLQKIHKQHYKQAKLSIEEMYERAEKAQLMAQKGLMWRSSIPFVENVMNYLRVRLIEDCYPILKCIEVSKFKKTTEYTGCSFVIKKSGYIIKIHNESVTWRRTDGSGSEGNIVIEGDSFAITACPQSILLRASYDSTESSIVHRICLSDLKDKGKLELTRLNCCNGYEYDSAMHESDGLVCIVTEYVDRLEGKLMTVKHDGSISNHYDFDVPASLGMTMEEFEDILAMDEYSEQASGE